jgi:universal stress protein E
MDLGKILTYIEPDEDSQNVVERTAWLAGTFGASVELFTCRYDKYLESEAARSSVLEADRSRLEELAEPLAAAGIAISADAVWARGIDDAILSKVEDTQPGLVVKATRYHSLLRRAIFSSEDWNLIVKCPPPLLLVRDRRVSATPTIMAAVDPMHDHDKPANLDRRILTLARRLRELAQATIRPVHVVDTMAPLVASAGLVEPPMSPVAAAAVSESPADRREALLGAARQAFERLLAEESLDVNQARLLEGDVANELVRFASDSGADMVIMGAVSRGLIDSALIGHTARRVLDAIDCDLLVVK